MQKREPEKIGVMGGSFDPIHIGHLVIAEHIAGRCGLDTVMFIPCCLPPHKEAWDNTPGRHRLRMIELAVEGNPRFRASDIELKRGGVSYSIDTVNELLAMHGRERGIHFIIGADSLPELATWKDYKKLLSLCTFVTAGRPGFDLDNWRPDEGSYTAEEIALLKKQIVPAPLIGISSTGIRKRRREGESIRYLVPEQVERYIVENKLYVNA